MAIISAFMFPLLGCVAGVFVCIRKNQSQGSSTKSWRFSDRGSIINDQTLSRQTTPLKYYDRTLSPVSDSSSSASGTARKRRTYDGVYYTHEPLPNRPVIDFEEKDWDLREPSSFDGSESTIESSKKTGTPNKESDV